jgi:hypothetical protein
MSDAQTSDEIRLRKGGVEEFRLAGVRLELVYASIGLIVREGLPLVKVPQVQLRVFADGGGPQLMVLTCGVEQAVGGETLSLLDVYEQPTGRGVELEALLRIGRTRPVNS